MHPRSRDYPCFDFVLRSNIALPELVETHEPAPPNRIVTIRVHPGGPVASAPELTLDGEDAVLTVPGTARYRIRGGQTIIVETAPDASLAMVRLFLLGSALGIASMRRGLLLLHANAVVVDGAAFAFAGPSGAGKSTLAAHFEAAGRPILCDDVCGITFATDGTPLAWPGLPRLKLWGDAVAALGGDAGQFDRVVEGHEKFQVPFAGAQPRSPVPFRALYVLDRADDGADGDITPLRGSAAMAALIDNSYRYEYLATLGSSAHHFVQCGALLAHARLFRVRRRWGFAHYASEMARIERHMEGS